MFIRYKKQMKKYWFFIIKDKIASIAFYKQYVSKKSNKYNKGFIINSILSMLKKYSSFLLNSRYVYIYNSEHNF
jgi:hypothetical protein